MNKLPLRFAALSLAAVQLAACGEEEAPAPKQTVERTAKKPEPATPAPAPLPPPVAQETYVVMPEDTGVEPPKNIMSAFDVGQAALEQWCLEQKVSCETFGRKDMQQEGDHWVTSYFGAPNGQGMFVNVRIYTDGRAEVVR